MYTHVLQIIIQIVQYHIHIYLSYNITLLHTLMHLLHKGNICLRYFFHIAPRASNAMHVTLDVHCIVQSNRKTKKGQEQRGFLYLGMVCLLLKIRRVKSAGRTSGKQEKQ